MEDIPTWVLQSGYSWHLLRRDRGHSLLLCVLAHSLPFVVPSVPPVSIENDANMTNKPGVRRLSLADLREAREHFHHLERGQRVAATLASRMMTADVPRCP